MESVGTLTCLEEPPNFPLLSQMNPVHAFLSRSFKVHFNIIRPSSTTSSDLALSFRLSDPNYFSLFFSFMYATCPVLPILLEVAILVIFGEEYKS